MSLRLFVYGTLRDATLVRQLTGRRFVTTHAVLAGYRKETSAGEYPVIVTAAEQTVDGLLLHDVDATSLRAFDAYEDEGRLYRRVTVTVSSGGASCAAQTYVGV